MKFKIFSINFNIVFSTNLKTLVDKMYRKILITLIIIVLVVLGAMIVLSNGNSNTDTQINFLSNKTLKNGDSIEFQLKDSQGNALANQNLIRYFCFLMLELSYIEILKDDSEHQNLFSNLKFFPTAISGFNASETLKKR